MKIPKDMVEIAKEIKEMRPEVQDDDALIRYCMVNTVDVIKTKGLTRFDYDEFMERLEQIETRLLEIEIGQKTILKNTSK